MHLDLLSVEVLLVIFLATLIRSTFGFGEGMVSVPLLSLCLPVAIAAPLAVMVSVLMAGVIVLQDWRKIQVRSAVGLVIAALFGIPLGVLLLKYANDTIVKSILGAILIGFASYSLIGKKQFHLEKDHPGLLLCAGFVSGILGGAYAMNGPPLVVYGSLRRWSPQHFRATLQGYFLPASFAALVGYWASGLWVPAITRYFLISLPGALVAILVGRFLNHRLRGDAFFKFVYAGLIVIGAALVVEAIEMHRYRF